MKLRNITFEYTWGASGVQGFFGEGYWFHKLGHWVGLDFSNVTFVSKTATPYPHRGNMKLKPDFQPQEYFPDCVKVKFLSGHMLNAVGLSNPGLEALLQTKLWQNRKNPFFISITSLANSASQRADEIKWMIELLDQYKSEFKAPFGLQINLSCPNTSHDPKEAIEESHHILEIASQLNVPLMPKYSIASAPIKAIMELQNHPACDAICVSNTLPFGWQALDWKKIWGSSTSPLESLGGGGLSGKTLRPLVCAWIKDLRNAGFTKHIHGGGGIMSPEDVDAYVDAGASSIYIGTVASLRPWRVPSIIKRAQQRLSSMELGQ